MPRKLPKGAILERTRHGKPACYFRRGKGLRIRLPLPSDPTFAEHYAAAQAGKPLPYLPEMPVTPATARKQRVERAMRRCLIAARSRSKEKNHNIVVRVPKW